ncbi:MAG TPA: GAF domain-containing protein [Arthrobacter sp.]|nr:GAF domain-containing protein [Arthrobacter sp.]
MSEAESYRKRLLDESPESMHEEIESQAGKVLAIMKRLTERRQHADELAVLNALSRRLASLREPRDVLQEVAMQARRLLATDVAYLMLLHEGNSLRIEVSDGSMGSVLGGIEIGPGQGLGGEVLRAGKPLWTEDYLKDSMIDHVRHVDDAASSEHLGGILGVPLMVGKEALGVLLAANRSPRKFSEREIELLAALAAHASVAIRNATLFEQQQRSAAALRGALAALKKTDDTRQRAFELRERLTGIVISGGRLTDILAELEQAAGVPVRFENAEHPEFLSLFSNSTSAVPVRVSPTATPRVAVPVLLSAGYGGCLVAESEVPLDEESVRLLSIGSSAVAIMVASERSLAEVELRTRSEFINTLLWSQADEESVARHGASVGIDIDKVSVVVVVSVDPGTGDAEEARRLAFRLAQDFHGWSGQHAEQIVILLPRAPVEAVKQRMQRLADGNYPGAIGIAPSMGGVRSVRSAHEAAQQTTALLNALGRSNDMAEVSELGIYGSVFSQAGRNQLAVFVRQTVGPLLSHDHDYERNLATTLSTYLDLSQHHARTCAALHIHANTLYQRLERITALIGPGWKEPSLSLDVQLALRLNGLMNSISQASPAVK